MSFASQSVKAVLVIGVLGAWSSAALSDGLAAADGHSSIAINATGPAFPAPALVDSTGGVSSGYRSVHFETTLADSLTYPFQVTPDNDTFFVSDYGGGVVKMYQFVAGGVTFIRSFGSAGSEGGQFSGPAQMAVVGNSLYVADYFNARIERFDKTTGAYVSQFGTAGSAPGQLSGPAGLVYNPVNGLLYVSETGNNRIQVFNTSGTYQFGFASSGAGNGQLTAPFGLAVDSVGNIYVADTGNNRISKFDQSGLWLRNIAPGSGAPYSVALDKADNVWMPSGAGDVFAYNSVGGYLSYYYGNYGAPAAWAEGYVLNIRGVAVTQPLNIAPYFGAPAIIITDGGSQQVQFFSASAQPIAHPAMDGLTGLSGYIGGIAYDSAENVYVTSYTANTVYKFNKFGALLLQWGSAGTGNGQFAGPYGIAVDDSDSVYVVDSQNNRIQKFDANGIYSTQWGTPGTGNGQFSSPGSIATDGLWVYVTDEANNRVQKFGLSGAYVRQWGTAGSGNGQMSAPAGIAVDRKRNQVYVAEYFGNRIQQFSVFGDFIKVLSDSTTSTGALSSPVGLATDQRGNLYVADRGNSRVVQYNDNGTYLANFAVAGANSIAVDRNAQLRVGTLNDGMVTRFGSTIGKSDTVGVYRPSNFTFYLRSALGAGAPDITATVTGATAGDVPLTGDWNGDGIDTPGLYRPGTSTFYLWDKWRGLDVATAPYQFVYGLSGDRPFVGDWDGDGRDGVGVFRASNTTQYLKNKLVAGSPDYAVIFGASGDQPVGGDWNQDGDGSAGVYRGTNGAFYLSNRNVTGSASIDAVMTGGIAGDLPVTGDWNHNGSTGVGFFRAGTFYLVPNDGAPDSTLFRNGFEPQLFTSFAFGTSGDIPLGGTWGQPPE